jgi:hypothetical protein
VAFRYTTGPSPRLETFPELNLDMNQIFGLNDSGTFCGRVVRAKGNRNTRDPFRYTQTLEILPPNGGEIPQDINSSGDLISHTQTYRDDWGWVRLDDLVVGSNDDLADWILGAPDLFTMNDRGGAADAGQLVGRLGSVAPLPILFVLTPEPAP